MSDSLERLYQAVLAARDLDPATSRTARLFQRGPSKMAKKLAEEAIEVVIDAVNGKADAVVRESADLLYNLTVLWASAGVTPEDVWREMERREDMLGIAEKLPKAKAPKAVDGKPASAKPLPKALPKRLPKTLSKTLPKPAAAAADRRRIVALEGRSLRKRH
jgi:phosphoribosyl-ATP pyrophosphohydrolase